MRMPWRSKEEPCGGIVKPKNTRESSSMEERVERAELKLRAIHEKIYGDKSICYRGLWMDYNGETNAFTIGNMIYEWGTFGLMNIPKRGDQELYMSQEEAMELAEFILDNYKGGNK